MITTMNIWKLNMSEVGQFLDNATFRTIAHRGGTITYVFATYIEDSSQVDLEAGGFFYQHLPDDCATDCPLCAKRITIYMVIDTLECKRNLCQYCENCNILFRARLIGTMDNYGNFIAKECIK